MFTGNYLSSTPRDLRARGVYLELRPLVCINTYACRHGYRQGVDVAAAPGAGTYIPVCVC
jgi:hypothetical protein